MLRDHFIISTSHIVATVDFRTSKSLSLKHLITGCLFWKSVTNYRTGNRVPSSCLTSLVTGVIFSTVLCFFVIRDVKLDFFIIDDGCVIIE